jgi:hypothetical protein
MKWMKLTVLLALLAVSIPASAQRIGFNVLLDCGFDERGNFIVHNVDTMAEAFVQGIDKGDDCLRAYAELRGRQETLRRRGASATVVGPRIAVLEPGAAQGCDIWDFQSNAPGGGGTSGECCPCAPVCECGWCPFAPPPTPVDIALLVCGHEQNGSLGVRFVGSNRPRLVADLRSETSCAKARAKLRTRFQTLGRAPGVDLRVRGPVPGMVLSTLREETLTFTYEAVDRTK